MWPELAVRSGVCVFVTCKVVRLVARFCPAASSVAGRDVARLVAWLADPVDPRRSLPAMEELRRTAVGEKMPLGVRLCALVTVVTLSLPAWWLTGLVTGGSSG